MRRAIVASLLLTSALQAKEISIRAARVLDGRGKSIRNAAVVVDGTRIVRIDPKPARVDYDLGNRTLMPGGIDTHVHIAWHFDAQGRSSEEGENERPEESLLYASRMRTRLSWAASPPCSRSARTPTSRFAMRSRAA